MDYSIFDSYELKTAFLPAMMILLPIPLALLAVFQVDNFPLKGSIVWTAAVFITLLFAIAMLVRYCGQKWGMMRCETEEEAKERKEGKERKEKEREAAGNKVVQKIKVIIEEIREIIPHKVKSSRPSTEYLRSCDEEFSQEAKAEISKKCEALFKIKLSDQGDIDEQDEHNSKVFGRILDYLYNKNPDGLWHKQQTLFHHARNIDGSRYLFVFIGLASLLASGLWICIRQKSFPNFIFFINAGYIVLVCLYIWRVIPHAMRHYAEYYATEAIAAFLILTRKIPAATDEPKIPEKMIYFCNVADLP